MLSVIVPTLNAAAGLGPCLAALKAEAGDLVQEIVVCDGGSTDGTQEAARAHGAAVIDSGRGRGVQLRTGAGVATGSWLLFLHGDTVLDPGWSGEARRFMTHTEQSGEPRAAAFRFALDDESAAARRMERMVAWRCRALKLPYGDQGLLISRAFYRALGGFKPIPLMEDVDLVRRIGGRRLSLLETRAVTSAERYRQEGYLWRPLRNMALLSLYFAGVPPRLLAKLYG